MIDFKLYPTERLIYVYADDADGIDIYDFDLSYIGNDAPKIVLTNSIYKVIACSINNVYNEIDDEHISYQLPEQYVGIDTSTIECNSCNSDATPSQDDTSVIECNSCNSDVTPNQEGSSNKKRIVALIHWWFIDRDNLEFNLIENIHIDNVINKILPVCDEVRLNVVFDTDKYEYRQFIENYFYRFDKIHITYDINDISKCEYITYQHVFDYDNCYVMYMHFKGVSCLKSKNGCSTFCKHTIDTEIYDVKNLYDNISSFNPKEIENKIFWGWTLFENIYYNGIRYESTASRLFYPSAYYVINVDLLKYHMASVEESIKSIQDLPFFSEYSPSVFSLEFLYFKTIFDNNKSTEFSVNKTISQNTENYDKKKYALITCIYGNGDILRNVYKSDYIDYICVTDNPNLKSNTWKIIYDPINLYTDNRAKTAYVKLHPWKYTNADFIFTADSSMDIINDLRLLIHEDADCYFKLHPCRDNLYDELCTWKSWRKMPNEQADNFLACANNLNVNVKSGPLYECNVVILKNIQVVRDMYDWVFNTMISLKSNGYDAFMSIQLVTALALLSKFKHINVGIIDIRNFFIRYEHNKWVKNIDL